ncbi:MAG: DUF2795 domain-containing protein [Patescibacteria group bacterium]
MLKTVFVLFDNSKQADEAISKLQASGYKPEDISIITKETGVVRKEEVDENRTEHVGGRTLKGAGIGLVAGLIVGAAAFTIPGVGAILVGGPLLTTLGLSGVAATTVAGGITGLLAGGIIGTLVGLGVPEEQAKIYEERIKEGAILLAVPAQRGQEKEIQKILEDSGATNVSMVDLKTPEEVGQKPMAQKGKATQGQVNQGQFEHTHEEDEPLVNPIQIQRFLKNIDYPASRQDLINVAKKEGADENVIATLEHLPDREYDGPVGVSEEIGKLE